MHVSQQLCTFHRSCARFTSPLIMFVFNCIGATKHVFPIYILYYTHKQQYVVISMMGKNLWVVVLTDNCNRKIIWPSKEGFLYHHIIGITCQSTRFTVTKVRSTFVWRWGNYLSKDDKAWKIIELKLCQGSLFSDKPTLGRVRDLKGFLLQLKSKAKDPCAKYFQIWLKNQNNIQ